MQLKIDDKTYIDQRINDLENRILILELELKNIKGNESGNCQSRKNESISTNQEQ